MVPIWDPITFILCEIGGMGPIGKNFIFLYVTKIAGSGYLWEPVGPIWPSLSLWQRSRCGKKVTVKKNYSQGQGVAKIPHSAIFMLKLMVLQKYHSQAKKKPDLMAEL